MITKFTKSTINVNEEATYDRNHQELDNKIINLVKMNRISSVLINDKRYDYSNIRTYCYNKDDKIIIAHKFLKLFSGYDREIIEKNYLPEFTKKEKNSVKIIQRGFNKILRIRISNHARERFVERTVKGFRKEILNRKLRNILSEYEAMFKDIYYKKYKNIEQHKKILDSLIIEVIRGSENIKLEKKNYPNSLFYLNFPYLFVKDSISPDIRTVYLDTSKRYVKPQYRRKK